MGMQRAESAEGAVWVPSSAPGALHMTPWRQARPALGAAAARLVAGHAGIWCCCCQALKRRDQPQRVVRNSHYKLRCGAVWDSHHKLRWGAAAWQGLRPEMSTWPEHAFTLQARFRQVQVMFAGIDPTLYYCNATQGQLSAHPVPSERQPTCCPRAASACCSSVSCARSLATLSCAWAVRSGAAPSVDITCRPRDVRRLCVFDMQHIDHPGRDLRGTSCCRSLGCACSLSTFACAWAVRSGAAGPSVISPAGHTT